MLGNYVSVFVQAFPYRHWERKKGSANFLKLGTLLVHLKLFFKYLGSGLKTFLWV